MIPRNTDTMSHPLTLKYVILSRCGLKEWRYSTNVQAVIVLDIVAAFSELRWSSQLRLYGTMKVHASHIVRSQTYSHVA